MTMLKKRIRNILTCIVVCTLAIVNVFAVDRHVHVTSGQIGPGNDKHPHEETIFCDICQIPATTYRVRTKCSQCTAGAKTVSNTAKETFVFVYGDSDMGIGVPILASVPCEVTYTNEYGLFDSLVMIYPPPPLASFSSSVRTSANAAVIYPDVVCLASRTVEYYNSQKLVATQQLNFGSNTSIASIYPNPHPLIDSLAFQVNEMPTHTIAGGGFAMSGAIGSHDLTVKTNF